MNRISVSLDDETFRWLEREAAARGLSPSDLLGILVRQHVPRVDSDSYRAAMESYLARSPTNLSSGSRYPTRDEIHEREHPFRTAPPGE